VRWEELDEDLTYGAHQLDRDVVAEDQIRTVIRAFRDRLFTDIFPGRTEVPKTLIFAKDDNHAENIVRIVREEFGKGNDFCQKITYRVSGVKSDDLIAEFRNSYFPRIAVTVDMIATGTDIKPLEVLLFMRMVKSRGLFEQMLGRGTRVISPTDLQAVTPDATVKTHFVIVDAVGIVEHPKADTQSLDRERSVAFGKLLQRMSYGADDPETFTTLAGRLARLGRTLTPEQHDEIVAATNGRRLSDLANALLDAVDPDKPADLARANAGGGDPTPEQIQEAKETLLRRAAAPFDDPQVRATLLAFHQRNEQIIDVTSRDRVRETGFSVADTYRARATVESFQAFVEEHRDEITALQIIYNRPYSQRRLTYAEVKELAKSLEQPPHGWTAEALWRAYAQVERDRVRGAGAKRVLTDLVSLVRHVVQPQEELVPYPDLVRERYDAWLAANEASGRTFTHEQRWWLDRIAGHIGVNLTITPDDLNMGEFYSKGGQVGALRVFGKDLRGILEELNTVLAA
jgi:type I restriction enzyme R subunit